MKSRSNVVIWSFPNNGDFDPSHNKDGELKTVTDVRDVPLTVTDKNIKKPAVNGKNMVLTIDRNVQSKVEEALVAGGREIGRASCRERV